MASTLTELVVKIGADISEFDREVGKLQKGFKPLSDKLQSVGESMTKFVTVPLTLMGGYAFKMSSDFEGAMNRVSALGEITGADLEKLRKQALKLGGDTKFSALEAAEAMGELGAAGFSTTQIYESMPGVLSLAAAGELDVARAAEIAANMMAGFGIEAGQMAGVADVLAKAAAAGTVNVQEMGLTMKYVGPLASAAGLSFEEVAAATVLLSNAGIKGEQAGTSLRGALSALLSPSTKAAEALDRLGIVTTDASGKLLPLESIVEQLGASGATTTDIFTIFGQETASAMQSLVTGGAPALRTMTAELRNADGAAKAMADTMNSGSKGAMEQFMGAVDTLAIAVGDTFRPAVDSLLKSLTKVIDVVTEFVLAHPAISKVGAAFAGLAAATGPVLFGLGKIVEMWPTLLVGAEKVKMAFTALRAGAMAFTTALGPWGLAIGAAAAAGLLLYKNWDKVIAFFKREAPEVLEAFAGAWDEIEKNAKIVWEAVSKTVRWAIDELQDLFDAVVREWDKLWEEHGDAVLALLGAAWRQIVNVISTSLEVVARVIQSVMAAIRGDWSAVWAGLSEIVDTVWDFIKKSVLNAVDVVLLGLGKLLSFIPGLEEKVAAAREHIAGIIDAERVKQSAQQATNAVAQMATDVTVTQQDITKVIAEATGKQASTTEGATSKMKEAYAGMQQSLVSLGHQLEIASEDFDGNAAEARILEKAYTDLRAAGMDPLDARLVSIVAKLEELHTRMSVSSTSVKALGRETLDLEEKMKSVGLVAMDGLKEKTAALTQEVEKSGWEAIKFKNIWTGVVATVKGAFETLKKGGSEALYAIADGFRLAEYTVQSWKNSSADVGQKLQDSLERTIVALDAFVPGLGSALSSILSFMDSIGAGLDDIFKAAFNGIKRLLGFKGKEDRYDNGQTPTQVQDMLSSLAMGYLTGGTSRDDLRSTIYEVIRPLAKNDPGFEKRYKENIEQAIADAVSRFNKGERSDKAIMTRTTAWFEMLALAGYQFLEDGFATKADLRQVLERQFGDLFSDSAFRSFWAANASYIVQEAKQRFDVAQREVPGFSRGGIVNAPLTGMPAVLHGREAILPLDRLPEIMREALSLSAPSVGAGSVTQTIQVILDSRVVAEAVVRDMPDVFRLRGIG